MIDHIKQNLSTLEEEIESGLKYCAKERIRSIIHQLKALDFDIDIHYLVQPGCTTNYILLDSVVGIGSTPVSFELGGSPSFLYKWPGIIQEVDMLNNALLLKYPLPEIPMAGTKAVPIYGGVNEFNL